MTLTTTASRVPYVGTGTTGPFAFPFKVFAAIDLRVTKRTAGADITLVYPTDFSVSGINSASGSVTLAVALQSSETLTIRRAPTLTQPTSIRNQGPYFPATHEDVFDRLTMIDQSQQDQLDRALKLGESTDPTSFDTRLPNPDAGKAMMGTGSGFTMSALTSGAVALPGEKRTVSTLTSYLFNNAKYNVDDYGALGDNASHPLSVYFGTLAAAQAVYPPATALTNELDWAAAATAAAQANTKGSGRVTFSVGRNYRMNKELTWLIGVNWEGETTIAGDFGATPPTIRNATTDLFLAPGGGVSGQRMAGLNLISEAGGGHIINAAIMSRCEFEKLSLTQANTAKSILNAPGGVNTGYYGNWWHHFDAHFVANNSVAAFNIKSETINQIVFEHGRVSRSTVASNGTYAFWVESTNASAPALAVRFHQITFEVPGGGAIRWRSVSFSKIQECGVYDMGATIPANPLVFIDKAATGVVSQTNVIDTPWFVAGNAGSPDVKIDTLNGCSALILGGKIGVLDGNDPAGLTNQVVELGVLINTRQNICTVGFDNAQLIYRATAGLITSFQLLRGQPGAGDGYLQFILNGNYAGSITSALEWRFGGTTTAPKVQLTTTGRILAADKLYPGTDAAAQQTAAGIFGGTGAPNNANGVNGDFYLRSDGGALTTVYQKRAGAWVGIV